jgi:hypothetical protein
VEIRRIKEIIPELNCSNEGSFGLILKKIAEKMEGMKKSENEIRVLKEKVC